jgi:hypothetical protein
VGSRAPPSAHSRETLLCSLGRTSDLAIIASEAQGCVDDSMWVEEGGYDDADDQHVTSLKSVIAWAATAAGPTLWPGGGDR